MSEALLASASPQVRNMGTMGGNLLQRTRCSYFRDTGFICNKREPGSGCPAIKGESRMLAILGVSDQCIATHPSDLPVALMALDAAVVRANGSRSGRCRLPISIVCRETHRIWKQCWHLANSSTLSRVPIRQRRVSSHYLKVRDRASFEFALVSAAVALETSDGTVRDVRVAAGGVGARPWRLPEVEAALRNATLSDGALREASARARRRRAPADRTHSNLPCCAARYCARCRPCPSEGGRHGKHWTADRPR